MKTTKSSNIKSNIIVVLTSIFAACVFAEMSLIALDSLNLLPAFFNRINVLTPPWYTKQGPGLYYAHPYASYAMKPNYVSANGDAIINSLGFRGREFAKEKPEDVFRIVALGASTTYGIGLPDEFTYPHLLERKLREILNSGNIEVINAGLVSATTAESLHRLYTDILPIDPDMIVIYHGYNDLVPRMFDNFSEDYYEFRKIPVDKKSFFGRLYLYRIIFRALSPKSFSDNVNLLSYTWKLENLPGSDEDKKSNFRQNSSATFGRNLRHIVDIAKSNNIDVVLSTFAINENVSHWNPHMPDELWAVGISENNSEIRNVADDYKLPLIEFQKYASQNDKMFSDSIHMNIFGSQKKADFFAEHIAVLVSSVN